MPVAASQGAEDAGELLNPCQPACHGQNPQALPPRDKATVSWQLRIRKMPMGILMHPTGWGWEWERVPDASTARQEQEREKRRGVWGKKDKTEPGPNSLLWG